MPEENHAFLHLSCSLPVSLPCLSSKSQVWQHLAVQKKRQKREQGKGRVVGIPAQPLLLTAGRARGAGVCSTTSGDTAAFPNPKSQSWGAPGSSRAELEWPEWFRAWSNSAPSPGESVELVWFQWWLNTENLAPFCCTNHEKGVSHFYGIFIILLHSYTTMSVPLSDRDLLLLIQLLISCTTSKWSVRQHCQQSSFSSLMASPLSHPHPGLWFVSQIPTHSPGLGLYGLFLGRNF